MGQESHETQRMERGYLSRIDAAALLFAEIEKVDGLGFAI